MLTTMLIAFWAFAYYLAMCLLRDDDEQPDGSWELRDGNWEFEVREKYEPNNIEELWIDGTGDA